MLWNHGCALPNDDLTLSSDCCTVLQELENSKMGTCCTIMIPSTKHQDHICISKLPVMSESLLHQGPSIDNSNGNLPHLATNIHQHFITPGFVIEVVSQEPQEGEGTWFILIMNLPWSESSSLLLSLIFGLRHPLPSINSFYGIPIKVEAVISILSHPDNYLSLDQLVNILLREISTPPHGVIQASTIQGSFAYFQLPINP